MRDRGVGEGRVAKPSASPLVRGVFDQDILNHRDSIFHVRWQLVIAWHWRRPTLCATPRTLMA